MSSYSQIVQVQCTCPPAPLLTLQYPLITHLTDSCRYKSMAGFMDADNFFLCLDLWQSCTGLVMHSLISIFIVY